MTDINDFAPYEPGPHLPATRPPRPAAPGQRRGRAHGVTTRVESLGSTVSSQTVLSFRLVDPAAGRPVEVELRGLSLAGTVRDGDWVEVAGEPERSGRLEVAKVRNVTTGSEMTAIGSSTLAGAKVFTIIFFAILAAAVVIAIWMFQQAS